MYRDLTLSYSMVVGNVNGDIKKIYSQIDQI
jgi:hypothetical protein